MQISQTSNTNHNGGFESAPRAGEIVRVRAQRWCVLDVEVFEHCKRIVVKGVGSGNSGLTRQFLTPFETVGVFNRSDSFRVVSPRLWRRRCRGLLAANTPPGGLRAARRARIDLLPHQLEPALAVVRGLGSRLLLADEVGLGKTIQAALILSELRARGLVDRALILAPASLRDQWADELARRFELVAAVIDAHELRRLITELQLGVNPWSTIPLAIGSLEYVKRPETLVSVCACRWDLLIVDEAHTAAGETERHDAVSALASRSPYVLLLTATPHSGDARTFSSLCA